MLERMSTNIKNIANIESIGNTKTIESIANIDSNKTITILYMKKCLEY